MTAHSPSSVYPRPSRVTFLLVYFCVLFVAATALRPLGEPDEGRYTAVALQMLTAGTGFTRSSFPSRRTFPSRRWCIWTTMLGLRRGGCGEWAARLPNMRAWIGILFLLLRVGRQFMPERSHAPALLPWLMWGGRVDPAR